MRSGLYMIAMVLWGMPRDTNDNLLALIFIIGVFMLMMDVVDFVVKHFVDRKLTLIRTEKVKHGLETPSEYR